MIKKSVTFLSLLVGLSVSIGACTDTTTPGSTDSTTGDQTFTVSFSQANEIFQARCINCHSTKGGTTEAGISFDTGTEIKKHVSAVNREAVLSHKMPPNNNITGMTDSERSMLATWIKEGANIN